MKEYSVLVGGQAGYGIDKFAPFRPGMQDDRESKIRQFLSKGL
jgi:hypothetical protein